MWMIYLMEEEKEKDGLRRSCGCKHQLDVLLSYHY